jgi:HSP20 family molecular chaperone IbpA
MAAAQKIKTMPVYVLKESADNVRIIFDLRGALESDFRLYVSEDGKRLHLVGEKDFSDSMDEYLWTFELPKAADIHAIRSQEKDGVYTVIIPKKKFWPPFLNQAMGSVRLRTAVAI